MRYRIEFRYRDGMRIGTPATPTIVESHDFDAVLAVALKKERMSSSTSDPLIAIGISHKGVVIIDEKKLRTILMKRWAELEKHPFYLESD